MAPDDADKLPTYEEFYHTFGKYMGIIGLGEVHVEKNTSTRTYRITQMLLLIFAMFNLFWAMFAEAMWLIMFVVETQTITMEDLVPIIELIGCNMCVITVVVKFGMMVICRGEILQLLTELRRLYHSDFTTEEKATLNQAIKSAITVITIYVNNCIVVAASYNFFFLAMFIVNYLMTGNTDIELSYSMWYFYDPKANLVIFIFTYICQVLQGNLVVHNIKTRIIDTSLISNYIHT
jgi:hypothetical protein